MSQISHSNSQICSKIGMSQVAIQKVAETRRYMKNLYV
jgi:hypothetical protein